MDLEFSALCPCLYIVPSIFLGSDGSTVGLGVAGGREDFGLGDSPGARVGFGVGEGSGSFMAINSETVANL